VRFVQLMCAELHVINSASVASATITSPPAADSLGERVSKLESEVAGLREELAKIKQSLGI